MGNAAYGGKELVRPMAPPAADSNTTRRHTPPPPSWGLEMMPPQTLLQTPANLIHTYTRAHTHIHALPASPREAMLAQRGSS